MTDKEITDKLYKNSVDITKLQRPESYDFVNLNPSIKTLKDLYNKEAKVVTFLCDATTSTFTVNLPQVAITRNVIYKFQKVDSSANVVNISSYPLEKIMFTDNIILALQGSGIEIVSNGKEWIGMTSGVSSHNSLSGIQGGAENDHQHITTTQLGYVNNAVQRGGDTMTGELVLPSMKLTGGQPITWNATDKTINIPTGSGANDPVLQVGQEQFLLAINKIGSTGLNGQVVYIDTAESGRPTIKLANNKSEIMARKTIGMITADVLNDGIGVVTLHGTVRGLNTSSFSLGDTLYVSETDGGLTATEPTGSRWCISVGIVTKVGTTDGEIFVKSIHADEPHEVTPATGFPNQNNPIHTISFTDIDRTLVIQPKSPSTEFNFYQKRVQYRKLTADTKQITDVEGVHWIYYELGVLTEAVNPTVSQAESLIRNNPLVAQIYWDATNKMGVLVGHEDHGYIMSGDTHAYLHFTRGAVWVSGMALNTINATGDGSLDSHAQFGVDMGVGSDEDKISIAAAVTSTTGLPILYLTGANSYLRRTAQAGYSVLTDVTAGVGSTGRLVYNKLTTGTWSLAVVTDNNYVLCHVFETNDPNRNYVAFIGQAEYNTAALARTAAESEIGKIITTFPRSELIPVATVIFNTKNTFANAVKAKIVEVSSGVSYVDWRTSEIKAAGGSPTDHNSLSGIQGGTTGEFYHLTSAQLSALHAKQHSLQSTADHTSTATAGTVLKADASGLPVDSVVRETASVIEIVNRDLVITQPTNGGTRKIYFDQNNAGGANADVSIISKDGNLQIYSESQATSRIYFASDGNTGIGTITPDAKLHTYDGTADNYLKIESAKTGGGQTVGIEFKTIDGSGYVKQREKNIVILPVNGGYVGINTNPLAKFHVKSATDINYHFGFIGSDAAMAIVDDANVNYVNMIYRALKHTFQIGNVEVDGNIKSDALEIDGDTGTGDTAKAIYFGDRTTNGTSRQRYDATTQTLYFETRTGLNTWVV